MLNVLHGIIHTFNVYNFSKLFTTKRHLYLLLFYFKYKTCFRSDKMMNHKLNKFVVKIQIQTSI
jgi:hypothetical protein